MWIIMGTWGKEEASAKPVIHFSNPSSIIGCFLNVVWLLGSVHIIFNYVLILNKNLTLILQSMMDDWISTTKVL